jgi:hypothetical protein
MKMPPENERLTKTCVECASSYFSTASEMDELCPECAHYLYGYPNCDHVWVNDRCTKCGWDGSGSDYIRGLIRKAGGASD